MPAVLLRFTYIGSWESCQNHTMSLNSHLQVLRLNIWPERHSLVMQSHWAVLWFKNVGYRQKVEHTHWQAAESSISELGQLSEQAEWHWQVIKSSIWLGLQNVAKHILLCLQHTCTGWSPTRLHCSGMPLTVLVLLHCGPCGQTSFEHCSAKDLVNVSLHSVRYPENASHKHASRSSYCWGHTVMWVQKNSVSTHFLGLLITWCHIGSLLWSR